MTWHVDPETGEVFDANDTLVTTVPIEGITIPDDARDVALEQLTATNISALTTDELGNYLDAVSGNVVFGRP